MVKGGVIFPMISDPNGTIGTLYGVYDREKGTDHRGHFLIDPDGTIQVIEIFADPIGRNISEILRQIRALRHQRETGDYIPCGWQPGKPTLHRASDSKMRAGQVWKTWKTRDAF